MTKPPELNPCPFCGCETVEDFGESTWSRPVKWMYCPECNAKGPRVMMQRNEEAEDWMDRAIAAWNNRTPDPAVQALVEAAYAEGFSEGADGGWIDGDYSKPWSKSAALRAIGGE